ncbi:MAG: serine/threonine protein kinase [Bacteroidales bacterium]|jgi:serine/threonine-protein kinase|nr:serine/threonine protein kinase [Bacteroidales bacterium]
MIRDCTIIKELPQGGQKIVHLAEHSKVGKVVIKEGTIKSFTSLERIKREVELLSELESDFYPKQHHFNIDVKTKKFEIVEDYIEGKVLREVMTEFKTTKEIFTLFNSLIKGLSVIWDKNIVHRDLKPENIIIRPNGMPCIIDLGIARFLDLESLTKTISPMGPCTPIYAAPEQLANNKNLIDPRTDFFSLGIIVLELYLGVHPYDPACVGNQFSIVENIMQNKYVVETDTKKRDGVIVELANKTLQTQPYERFRNYKMLNAFIAKQI